MPLTPRNEASVKCAILVNAVASLEPRRFTMKVPGKAPLWVAGATLAAGFGVLVVLSLLQPAPAHLPGLWDFASATWGDGVALPLMAGSLTYAVRALPPARREAMLAVLAGLAGGGLGVATQVSWLSADTPRLNWTLPQPHHFTTAGWYHAGFLVAVSAVLAALWTVALWRAARAVQLERRAEGALATALAAGVSFVVFLALDAHRAILP